MYKIEKNVPMTNNRIDLIDDSTRYTQYYPLDHMKVGDSFLVPFTKKRFTPKKICVPYEKAREKGIEISCRTESRGVRIWRIE
jgi:hypothetical protein